jgi:hypothetical protein
MTTFKPKGFSWVKSLGGGRKKPKGKKGAPKSGAGKSNAWRAYATGKKR